MAYLGSPNLGQSLAGWRPLNLGAAVTIGQENDASLSRTTTSYAYARTTQSGGSFALDFPWPTWNINYVGQTNNGESFGVQYTMWPPSITVLAWVRVRPGQSNFSAQLSLWGLGAAPQPHDFVNFNAGQEWQLVTVSSPNASLRTRRIEFYLGTVGSDLLIDSVAVL